MSPAYAPRAATADAFSSSTPAALCEGRQSCLSVVAVLAANLCGLIIGCTVGWPLGRESAYKQLGGAGLGLAPATSEDGNQRGAQGQVDADQCLHVHGLAPPALQDKHCSLARTLCPALSRFSN